MPAPIKPVDIRETWRMTRLREIWKNRTDRRLVAYLPGTGDFTYISLGRATLIDALRIHEITEEHANSDLWEVGEMVSCPEGQPMAVVPEASRACAETMSEEVEVTKMVPVRNESGKTIRDENGDPVFEERTVREIRVVQTDALSKRPIDPNWGVK